MSPADHDVVDAVDAPRMVLFLNALQRVRVQVIIATSLGMLLVVAATDVLTGPEIRLSAFYLLPVVLTTSSAGARAGIGVAIITALTWLGIEIAVRHEAASLLVPTWIAAMRFAVYALVVALIKVLQATVLHERQLSRQDSLSGLPNSRAFYEIVEHERRRLARWAEPVTIACIDIDNFKGVNDSLGHAAGDEALCATAQTIRSTIREVDTASRLGGDEFAILLPGTSAGEAQVLLSRVHDALTTVASSQGWPIGYSVGAVTFTRAPGSVHEMVGMSDQVMYDVKHSVKNAVRAVDADDIVPVAWDPSLRHGEAAVRGRR